MAQDFSPTEIFKRATATTLRAIAERDDVNVTFGPEPAGRRDARALAEPGARPARRGGGAAARRRRQLGVAAELSRRRGACETRRRADRWRARSSRRSSRRGSRRWARKRMVGVAANLSAMLDEQYRRQGFEHITERTDGTMAEAVRLLTREALTDEPPPPAARKVVDLWRPLLEGKIARDFSELDKQILDQDAYARTTRRLIQDLDLDLGEMDDSSEDQQSQGDEQDGENQTESGESATAGAQPSMEGAPADGATRRRRAGRRRRDRRRDDAGRQRRRSRPSRPPRPDAARPSRRERDLPRLHHRSPTR